MAFVEKRKEKDENDLTSYEYRQLQKKKEKQKAKERKDAIVFAGMPIEQQERILHLINNPTTMTTYTFRHPQNPSIKQDCYGTEYSEFNGLEEQRVIHGVIKVYEYTPGDNPRVIVEDDIYVYQPRFVSRSGVMLGPRYKEDGSLDNSKAYAYKDITSGMPYITDIPKREIISNRKIDFDLSNEANFQASCQANFNDKHKGLKKLIRVEYDKTPNGLLRSVDINNVEELKALQEYMASRRNLYTADRQIEYYIQLAKNELQKVEEVEKEVQEGVHNVTVQDKMTERLQSVPTTQAQKSIEDENAKIVNDFYKYGKVPSYSSPLYHQGGRGMPGGRMMPPPGRRPGPHGPGHGPGLGPEIGGGRRR
ncbi:MAG: hypothetical protein J1F35_00025 [Erysipelotrichales bacterium]|nr:hypothetical protein [Erysipelotrichales bacterium]